MTLSGAQKRAMKNYAQTDKGQAALKRAHQKRTQTNEYRAYQREKQAEYRRAAKQSGSIPSTSPDVQTELSLHLVSSNCVSQDATLEETIPELDYLIEQFAQAFFTCLATGWLYQQSCDISVNPKEDVSLDNPTIE